MNRNWELSHFIAAWERLRRSIFDTSRKLTTQPTKAGKRELIIIRVSRNDDNLSADQSFRPSASRVGEIPEPRGYPP